MCLNADFVCAKQHNSTTEFNVHNCAVSSVKQSSSTDHNLPCVSQQDNRRPACTSDMSRPRPVRQSTGGQLMLARHGTTAPWSGDETGADSGLPTETAVKQPTRRASAPCNSSSTPAVSVSTSQHVADYYAPARKAGGIKRCFCPSVCLSRT